MRNWWSTGPRMWSGSISADRCYTPKLPCDATQIGRFRTAIGEPGVEKLLKATIDAAVQAKMVKPAGFERIIVDTTVQKKRSRIRWIVACWKLRVAKSFKRPNGVVLPWNRPMPGKASNYATKPVVIPMPSNCVTCEKPLSANARSLVSCCERSNENWR